MFSIMDNIEREDENENADSSEIDSDEDESICKSPQKSPSKVNSLLRRKRRYSGSNEDGPSNSQTESDDELEVRLK